MDDLYSKVRVRNNPKNLAASSAPAYRDQGFVRNEKSKELVPDCYRREADHKHRQPVRGERYM